MVKLQLATYSLRLNGTRTFRGGELSIQKSPNDLLHAVEPVR